MLMGRMRDKAQIFNKQGRSLSLCFRVSGSESVDYGF